MAVGDLTTALCVDVMRLLCYNEAGGEKLGPGSEPPYLFIMATSGDPLLCAALVVWNRRRDDCVA